ncbi:hypothetical protein [Fulvimonas soli]|uniref:hypothetical protein n=1 Tax=Fulvimonas soli TaxID=155197 RepID=UPI000D6D952C|nr:hypothetical protein [Fulvimonas soli]TNY25504.1 hypothetical protein BV497_13495 [Fulvimonas soli]
MKQKFLMSCAVIALVLVSMETRAADPTPGVGQNGAPTLSGCIYDQQTHQPVKFPPQITTGWIETNEIWNIWCAPPGGLPSPNWREMTYFLDMPVGSVMQVCWNGWTWPIGWTPVEYRYDTSKCGYHPGGIPPEGNPTVIVLRRDS